jgi:hypothetical protein
MQKIISLFQRNYEGDRLVRNEVVPGAEWVIQGEGVATRKYDGTCCKIDKGKLYKRYDAKHGKTPPVGFIPAQDPDPITGHWPGWLEVGFGPEDKYFVQGFAEAAIAPGVIDRILPDGTYELVGPKINGNKDSFTHHTLVLHGTAIINDAPRTYTELKEWFKGQDIEGIVWHHPDGRMVKIKKKDFGYKR